MYVQTRTPTAVRWVMRGVLPAVACGALSACGVESPNAAGVPDKPHGFEPASVVVREDSRVARCNTVHSLTLPAQIRERYSVPADESTAVISCSLQSEDGTPPNIASRASGTQTVLTGRTSPLQFREAVNEGVTVHMATFAIDAKSEIEFDVELRDERTGKSYVVELRQSELPGRL